MPSPFGFLITNYKRSADIRHRSLGSPQTTTDMGSLRPLWGSPNFSCIALLFLVW